MSDTLRCDSFDFLQQLMAVVSDTSNGFCPWLFALSLKMVFARFFCRFTLAKSAQASFDGRLQWVCLTDVRSILHENNVNFDSHGKAPIAFVFFRGKTFVSTTRRFGFLRTEEKLQATRFLTQKLFGIF